MCIKNEMFVKSLLLVGALILYAQGSELEVVSDDQLVHIMKQHSFAVVLFCGC